MKKLWAVRLLGLYLAGLLCLNKTFTYIFVWVGPVPLFISEAVLIALSATWAVLFLRNRIGYTRKDWWVLGPLCGYWLAFLVAVSPVVVLPQNEIINTLKRSALGYYSLFVFFVYSLVKDRAAVKELLFWMFLGSVGQLISNSLWSFDWWFHYKQAGIAAITATVFSFLYAFFQPVRGAKSIVYAVVAAAAFATVCFTTVRSAFFAWGVVLLAMLWLRLFYGGVEECRRHMRLCLIFSAASLGTAVFFWGTPPGFVRYHALMTADTPPVPVVVPSPEPIKDAVPVIPKKQKPVKLSQSALVVPPSLEPNAAKVDVVSEKAAPIIEDPVVAAPSQIVPTVVNAPAPPSEVQPPAVQPKIKPAPKPAAKPKRALPTTSTPAAIPTLKTPQRDKDIPYFNETTMMGRLRVRFETYFSSRPAGNNALWRLRTWLDGIQQVCDTDIFFGMGFTKPFISYSMNPFFKSERYNRAIAIMNQTYDFTSRLSDPTRAPIDDVTPAPPFPMTETEKQYMKSAHWFGIDFHNSHVAIFYRMGLVGLVSFAVINVVFICRLWPLIRRKDTVAQMAILFWLWYLIVAASNVVLEGPFLGVPFWVFIGLMLRYLEEKKETIECK